jgi:hypothetical protein
VRYQTPFKKRLLVPALAGVLGLIAFQAGTQANRAAADSTTSVSGLSSLNHVAVDGAGDVFLAGSGGIVVTSSSGSTITTLDSGDDVTGLALSTDGSVMYAAIAGGSSNADSVDKISLSSIASGTPAETYIPLSSGDVPASVAVQSGTIWVSYTDTGNNNAGIGSIDPSSNTFIPATSVANDWAAAPTLAADPNDSTLMAVAGGTAATYTTTGGTLAAGAAQTPLATCSTGASQLAAVPGSSSFIAACGSQDTEYTYSGTDLSTSASSYATGAGTPVGVAVASDGTVAVASASDIYVYTPGGTLENVLTPDGSASFAAGGLAWVGSQLAAVTDNGGAYAVQLFSAPTATKTTLNWSTQAAAYTGYVPLSGSVMLSDGAAVPPGSTVSITRSGPDTTTPQPQPVTVSPDGSFSLVDTPTVPGTYNYSATATINGNTSPSISTTVTVSPNGISSFTLSGPNQADILRTQTLTGSLKLLGGTVPAGTPITIARAYSGSTRIYDYTVTTGANGTFTFSQMVGAVGTFTYTAKYAGDPTLGIPAATAIHKMVTTKLTPALTVTGPTSYSYGSTMSVTVHLGQTYSNRTVSVYAQPAASKTKKLLKTGTVSSNGTLTVSYRTPYSTIFTAAFSGDAEYRSLAVTHEVSESAYVGISISGFYTSKNGVGYYHKSTSQLGVSAAVSPNKSGECVQFEVQEYYNGAWHANTNTGCHALNSASRLTGYLLVNGAYLGDEYRIRADYIHSSRDTNNLNVDSGWRYLYVES